MRKCSIKLKVANIKKTISFLFIILAFVMIITFIIPSNKVGGKSEVTSVSYSVAFGDTLWSIAEELRSGNKDVREIIYEIRKLNGFSKNYVISAGEVILIPEY